MIFIVIYAQVTFKEKPQMKIKRFIKLKHGYIIQTWSDKAFKGAVVNWALLSFYGGSHEITLDSMEKWLKLIVDTCKYIIVPQYNMPYLS